MEREIKGKLCVSAPIINEVDVCQGCEFSKQVGTGCLEAGFYCDEANIIWVLKETKN